MTDKEKLMRKINANEFAMWELHINLDTHPGDCEAADKLESYKKTTNELIAKYEKSYGPINENSSNTNRWAWIASPWPWEIGEGD